MSQMELPFMDFLTVKQPSMASGQITKEGVKYDSGKPQMELIAPDAMEGLAKVLTFGASKYAARNWEKGMSWSRVFGALLRHLWKYWRGEDLDEETGLPHIDHAMCCVMFLSSYQKRKVGTDDRNVL